MKIHRLLVLMVLCGAFATAANAAITPGTYTFDGDLWAVSDPLLNPGSILTIAKVGEFGLFGGFSSYTVSGPIVETVYTVAPGLLILAPAAFGEGATNVASFDATVFSTGPVDSFVMLVLGGGTLTTGQNFTYQSYYEGTVVPGTVGGGIKMGDGTLSTEITVDPVVPAPGAFVLGSLGVSLVGWLRRRRAV